MSFSKCLHESHGKACPYCGEKMHLPATGKRRSAHPFFPTRDHIIPRSRGAGGGVIIVCQRCNSDKSGLLVKEWLQKLEEQAGPRAEVVKGWLRSRL